MADLSKETLDRITNDFEFRETFEKGDLVQFQHPYWTGTEYRIAVLDIFERSNTKEGYAYIYKDRYTNEALATDTDVIDIVHIVVEEKQWIKE